MSCAGFPPNMVKARVIALGEKFPSKMYSTLANEAEGGPVKNTSACVDIRQHAFIFPILPVPFTYLSL